MLRVRNFLCRCLSKPDDDEDGHEFPVEKLYEFGEVIGQGRLGVVYKCTDRTTGEQFACKKMPATGNAMREMDSLYMLQHCSPRGHPGILRSIAYFPQERVGKSGWSENVYMISDLCDGGDLQHFIDAYYHRILSERLAARIIHSLVQSLQYCHFWKIIHRDVKPSSIFISNTANNVNPSSWDFKLGNFDMSIRNGSQNVSNDNVGTLRYSAPEMLSGNGYSYEVDIWSAGVVLYVLLFARTPFYPEDDAMVMYEQIQNTEPTLTGRFTSDSAKDLVLGMLKKDRTRRFSCDQILNHPWILAHVDHPWISANVEIDVASSSTINTQIVSTAGEDAAHQ